jgi:hypothetical protein
MVIVFILILVKQYIYIYIYECVCAAHEQVVTAGNVLCATQYVISYGSEFFYLRPLFKERK